MWLPEPASGTEVCGGFDGSDNDDFTVIKLETLEGHVFTPRYGADLRPTIWNPAEWGGRIPRSEVNVAWAELADRFRLIRVYADPGFHDERDWTTEIETWDVQHGPGVFMPWPTNQIGRMYPALRRFEADLGVARGQAEVDPGSRRIMQDGCPITTTHMGNARKIMRPGDRYILGKPSQHQKIDAAVTSVICHEAACDARSAGWGREKVDSTVFVFRR